jgi:hypothetical protein
VALAEPLLRSCASPLRRPALRSRIRSRHFPQSGWRARNPASVSATSFGLLVSIA